MHYIVIQVSSQTGVDFKEKKGNNEPDCCQVFNNEWM